MNSTFDRGSACSECKLLTRGELANGKCKRCARDKKWIEKSLAPTPVVLPRRCAMCKGPGQWGKGYCGPCNTIYNREWKQKNRAKVATRILERERLHREANRGLDMDAIYRNPRFKKLRRAA